MSNRGVTSAGEFLDSLETLGLIPPDKVAALRAQCLADEIATAADAATRLIEENFITPFQAEQLLSGNGRACVLAGRYKIEEQLDSGGMGTVYRALDANLDRVVAIKLLPPDSVPDADAVARFQREAKALAKLSHPNIIQAFDSGQDQGRHFLVMEFVEGSSLARVLRQQGAIRPTIAADYIYQAALGLQHAHERGLVHRDLKPGNLLVTHDGRVKILDLGLARFLQDQVGDATLTRTGSGMGTPDYMPPEQFHNAHRADARSDIYSLGCTLYHLIAGCVPFPTSSLSEKYDSHENRQPQDVKELCPEIPAGLALTIDRMIAKRPADRFQSARDVEEALAPYVAGSSTSIRFLKETAGWQGDMRRLSVASIQARRRRRFLAGSALLLVGLFLWLGAGLWQRQFLKNGVPDQASAGSRSGEPPSGNPAREPEPSKSAESAPVESAETEPTVPVDPKVLTVAQDGTAQFRTISEALGQAKPGMTIRVLDKGVYAESLSIGRSSAHRGLTLEAVNGATISATRSRFATIYIEGVPEVTVRGFRLRADAAKVTFIAVKEGAAGSRFEKLEMLPGAASDYDGIVILGMDVPDIAAPVVIQDCIMRSPQQGVVIMAIGGDYQTPQLISRVVIRGNRIYDPLAFAILLRGAVRRLQIVGNLIQGSPQIAAIQLDQLLEESNQILIANNTIFEAPTALRLWDSKIERKDIEVSNNLILGLRSTDMMFIDSGGMPEVMRGAGDGASVPRNWKLTRNWRETKPPKADDPMAKAWIPPTPDDVAQNEIEVQSREATDPGFLRPAADSPLATGGAGADDPTLPRYVGALPPDGVQSWDWQTTWDARQKAR